MSAASACPPAHGADLRVLPPLDTSAAATVAGGTNSNSSNAGVAADVGGEGDAATASSVGTLGGGASSNAGTYLLEGSGCVLIDGDEMSAEASGEFAAAKAAAAGASSSSPFGSVSSVKEAHTLLSTSSGHPWASLQRSGTGSSGGSVLLQSDGSGGSRNALQQHLQRQHGVSFGSQFEALVGASAGATAAEGATDVTEEAGSTALLLESALDSLVSQLSSSSLRRDFHQRMADQLRSADIAARLEATQAYRRSLAHRQELEQRQQQQQEASSCSVSCAGGPDNRQGQSPSATAGGLGGNCIGGVAFSQDSCSPFRGPTATASTGLLAGAGGMPNSLVGGSQSGSGEVLLGGRSGNTLYSLPSSSLASETANNSRHLSATGGVAEGGQVPSSGRESSTLEEGGASGAGGGGLFVSSTTGGVMDVTVEDIVKSDLLLQVVASLSMPHPLLQLESVLLIQRLCRGSSFAQLRRIVSRPLLNALVQLLLGVSRGTIQAGAVELRAAVLSLLAKLAQEYKTHRDYSLLKPLLGIVPAVLEAAQVAPDVEGARCVHALVCSNLQQLKVDVAPILDLLVWFLKNSREQQVLCLAASACVALCERPEGVDVVLASPALPTVLQLLRQSDDQRVIFDALSVAAKIAFVGSTSQIDRAIGMGAVQAMMDVLLNPAVSNPTTRARACNTLGNLGCETPKQVQPIIDTQAFPLLVEIFQNDPDYNTRIEAAYAVCACLSRADPNQVGYIISCTSRAPAFFPSPFSRRRAFGGAPPGGATPGAGAAGGAEAGMMSGVFLQTATGAVAGGTAVGGGTFSSLYGGSLMSAGGGSRLLFGGPWSSNYLDRTPPAVLSFGCGNPCLRLIADMLELVCESDPTNGGSLKLCKAILRGLDNILDVGAQEAKMLGLTENPYAILFHEVQGDLKLSQMQFFPEYYIAAKTHSILEKYFDVATTWNSKQKI